MKLKTIIIPAAILLVCAIGVFVFSANLTGKSTYDEEAILSGVDISTIVEWIDWPDHIHGHGVDHLTDIDVSNWQCSQSYNCSLEANFETPQTINEIHIYACNIKSKTVKTKYIPRDFEVWIVEHNKTEPELYHRVNNNTEVTTYKILFDEAKTITKLELRGLLGKDLYGIGDYDYPCIEEIKVFKPKTEAVASGVEVSQPAQEEQKGWLSRFFSWLASLFN